VKVGCSPPFQEQKAENFLEDINIMDAAAAAELVVGLKAIGAGLAMFGAIGAGLGIGVLVYGAVQGIARNPDAGGDIQTNMILGIAFAEAVAIYTLVVALIILFVI
jgi:F-type H+-transporting ATPase subunit c